MAFQLVSMPAGVRQSEEVFLLVFEDSEAYREIACLASQISQVTLFYERDTLLNTLNVHRPQLLLLPLRVDRAEEDILLIRQIRRRHDSHLLAILVFTEFYDPSIIRSAFRSGIEDCIPLPVNPELFINRLENILYHLKRRIHVNALTGLPGISLIEEEFYYRCRLGKSFSVAYADLDHFKPYNDEKGVKAGDRAIQLLSLLLHSLRREYSREEIFIGHLGGDDFFVLGKRNHVRHLLTQLYERFNASLGELFLPSEIEKGCYRSVSREGEAKDFPLLSISTALLHIPANVRLVFEELSEVAAKVKKKAKAFSGNSIVEYIWN